MSGKSRVQYGMIVTVVASALLVAGVILYVIRDVRESRLRIAASQRRYLKARAAAKEAREQAKDEARRQVAAHGTKATVEQKQKAYAIMTKKQRATKGPARFLAAARDARSRGKGFFRSGKPTELPQREFTPEEREILSVADEAVSDRDLETAVDVANAARSSKDPRVRIQAVETLMSFGEAGLPELADFLKDPHEEVANLAADRFDLATQEIVNDDERVAVAKLGMLSVEDEDRLRSLGGTMILASDSKLVIEALADVIRSGSVAQAAAAKGAYESQTGEEWKGEDAADRWLQENYEPPEPEESAEDVNNGQEGEDK